jgi:hypothetical protein
MRYPGKEAKYRPKETHPKIFELCNEKIQESMAKIDLENWPVIGFPLKEENN